MNEVQKLLAVARGEVGYHETGDNINKYAAELDKTDLYNGPKNGYAWCDVFVDWCFYKAFGHDRAVELLCQPTGECGAGCSFSAGYYKAAARWSKSPAVGAQVFFRGFAHTGIVEAINGNTTITTIEGNTSDAVVRRTYAIGDGQIDGYGIPDFREEDDISEPVGDPEQTESVDEQPDPSVRYIGMLSFGCMGDDVALLQALLEFWGYSVGNDGIDGEFGLKTEVALMELQEALGLEVDGIAGPETFAALFNIKYGGQL